MLPNLFFGSLILGSAWALPGDPPNATESQYASMPPPPTICEGFQGGMGFVNALPTNIPDANTWNVYDTHCNRVQQYSLPSDENPCDGLFTCSPPPLQFTSITPGSGTIPLSPAPANQQCDGETISVCLHDPIDLH